MTFAQTGLPLDNVDPEAVERPVHWDIRLIERFMIVIGPISTLFDIATFAVLLLFFHAAEAFFRTGWFVESLVTQILMIFAVRTRRSLFASRPHRAVVGLTFSYRSVDPRAAFPAGNRPVVRVRIPACILFRVSARRGRGLPGDDRAGETGLLRPDDAASDWSVKGWQTRFTSIPSPHDHDLEVDEQSHYWSNGMSGIGPKTEVLKCPLFARYRVQSRQDATWTSQE